jgi:hypothetical protein
VKNVRFAVPGLKIVELKYRLGHQAAPASVA